VPPDCATDASYDAIVVSEETLPGAEEINRVRSGLGFAPLVVVVVGVLHARGGGGAKLSSTDLRSLAAGEHGAADGLAASERGAADGHAPRQQ
jgi:phosphopantetheine adenylyltransferase